MYKSFVAGCVVGLPAVFAASDANRRRLPISTCRRNGLANSLKAIARQTSTNALFDLKHVTGLEAPPLKAQLTPEADVALVTVGWLVACFITRLVKL
jgi:hypothetical protein